MTERLRVSDVQNWARCELMALRCPPRESQLGVAAYVGSLAHALVSGTDPPVADARYRFDAVTPSIRHANTQARALARAAKATLADSGWQILDAEHQLDDEGTTGVYDLLCWNAATRERALIDLKTGRMPDAVWLQVGGYLTLLTLLDLGASLGGVLHVPRVRIDREPEANLQLRAAAPLRDAWRRRFARITEVIGGAVPLPTPGGHCDHCALRDCPVSVRTRRP